MMDEKIEEMEIIIAKAISDYLEEEGLTALHIKGRKEGTSTKIISNALYNAGYRKESDTAREILNKIRSLFPTAERCDFGDLYLIDKIKKIAEEYGVEVD